MRRTSVRPLSHRSHRFAGTTAIGGGRPNSRRADLGASVAGTVEAHHWGLVEHGPCARRAGFTARRPDMSPPPTSQDTAYVLRLFVTGTTPRSARAIANL